MSQSASSFESQPVGGIRFWAKTVDGQPGISVQDHCIHVACVAEAMMEQMKSLRRGLFPAGTATLAGLHDIGKISTGFQAKCPAWLEQAGLLATALKERWLADSETDHAKVSQYHLQRVLEPLGTHLWAVAAGVHHGRIFGLRLSDLHVYVIPTQEEWFRAARDELLALLIQVFGPLPAEPPDRKLSSLWCVAGLITVADWIGSNEAFFPADRGLGLEESRDVARRALEQMNWHGGAVGKRDFGELFGGYTSMPLQQALHEQCGAPGLFIVEGPMGCGKTEAALWAAHRLIESGMNDGLYFALPTQVTSNRIHRRVERFLKAALAEAANLRLAHAASWLEDHQTCVLHPSDPADSQAVGHVREGRSWFASSKHAMLARFGVGTVDQALQAVVAVKHFFVRRFGLAGKVVILDEVHSYDVYTGTLITQLIRELLALKCSVIVLSATLTEARRREILAAAATNATPVEARSQGYPLITVARQDQPVIEVSVPAPASRQVRMRTAAFSEEEILAELIARAEDDQHVLYLRNTVADAQETCRKARGCIRDARAKVACLHSRFPFFRRQELEAEWLDRLGKERAQDGRGSLLIATQVVEQSVDIDLDFIVSDLAPTDMLLQRMGRLWRHHRSDRLATQPEFWINAPLVDRDDDAETLARAFGRSGKVYAPYVLLRTAEVFTGLDAVALPGDIRALLEATYEDRSAGEEPPAWTELKLRVDKEREELAQNAMAVTKVLSRPSLDDQKDLLTRRAGQLMADVVLIRSCEPRGRDSWEIVFLDGETLTVSGREWSMAAARAVHRNLVRTPLYTVSRQSMPLWLHLHTHGPTFWAVVENGGALDFPEGLELAPLAYDAVLGLHTQSRQVCTHPDPTDDDEWD